MHAVRWKADGSTDNARKGVRRHARKFKIASRIVSVCGKLNGHAEFANLLVLLTVAVPVVDVPVHASAGSILHELYWCLDATYYKSVAVIELDEKTPNAVVEPFRFCGSRIVGRVTDTPQ